MDVYYKEGVKIDEDIINVIEDFYKWGVNFFYGYGSEYVEVFNLVSEDYLDMEFVIFNVKVKVDNVMSVYFSGEVMGFFGGMIVVYLLKMN